MPSEASWRSWPTPEAWQGTRSRWAPLTWGAAVVLLAWAAYGADLRLHELVRGAPYMADFLRRMFPPNIGYARALLAPTLETIQMALWGTLLAIGLAAPLGVLAARNLTPHPTCFWAARGLLNAMRGINELVFALVFVAAVGLGPLPGVLALAVHTAGMLGKFYAEAMEGVDPGPVEALLATGAGRLQTIRYAVLPQVLPAIVAFNLYRLEVSVRSATVLGLVGAGGIGFELMTSMRLFRYRDVAVILAVIVGLVVLTDSVSTRVRKRYL